MKHIHIEDMYSFLPKITIQSDLPVSPNTLLDSVWDVMWLVRNPVKTYLILMEDK